MRRLIALFFALCLVAPASAYWQSRDSNYNRAIISTSGCSEASTFVAAAKLVFPSYDSAHETADTTYICGLVSAGIFSELDFLHIEATQDVSVARINMIAPGTFDLVNVNPSDPPAFVADRGISVGPLFGQSQSTQYTPSTSGGKYALNSATIMVWSNTTGNSSGGEFGTAVGSNTFFITNSAVTGSQSAVSQSSAFTENTSNGAGMYLASRTASNNINNYWGASGTLNTLSPSSSASTSLPTDALLVNGISGYAGSNKQVSADAGGGSLTPTQAANFYTLTQARMTAVGN